MKRNKGLGRGLDALLGGESTSTVASTGTLPLQQRELIHLKFEAGLSYKQIAEAMRMSVSNVGVQLHTAIQTLRRLWKRENTGVIP